MKNVPEKIYLQVDADGETPDEFNELAVSWCSNKVHDNDIEYLLTNAVKQEGGIDIDIIKFIEWVGEEVNPFVMYDGKWIQAAGNSTSWTTLELIKLFMSEKLIADKKMSSHLELHNPSPPTDIKKITVEGILKSKLTQQAMIANNPDYTFEKVIEAMIEIAGTSFTAGYHYGIDETNPDKKAYLKTITNAKD